jgi:hypothetical protein
MNLSSYPIHPIIQIIHLIPRASHKNLLLAITISSLSSDLLITNPLNT